MQAKNDISDELRSLSALVAGIGRQTPYELPEGYFAGLPQMILNRIARPAESVSLGVSLEVSLGVRPGDGHGSEEAGLALNLSKSLAFSVPEGYFDDFASQVLNRIKSGASNVQSGDASTSIPALSMGALSVGEGVQEELARISTIVSRITRETPYRLPEGYFAEVSPILSVLKDKATYQVPEGYFDYLAAAAREKVIDERVGAKVVAIGSRGKSAKNHWWKYAGVAAAACLILVFSWPQFRSSRVDEQKKLPVDLAQTMSQGLHKVSDQEILNYLDDQNSILAEPVSNNTATLDMNDSDIKTLLGDVPDGELQQYMEEHGRANDIATN